MTMRSSRRCCHRVHWLVVGATWIVLVLGYVHNAVNAMKSSPDDEVWRRGGLQVRGLLVNIGARAHEEEEAMILTYAMLERMVRESVEDNKQSMPAQGGRWLYVWPYSPDHFFVVIIHGGGKEIGEPLQNAGRESTMLFHRRRKETSKKKINEKKTRTMIMEEERRLEAQESSHLLGGAEIDDPCETLLHIMRTAYEDAKVVTDTVFQKMAVMGEKGVYANWAKPDVDMIPKRKQLNCFCAIRYAMLRLEAWMNFLDKVTAKKHTIYYTVLPHEDWRAFSADIGEKYPIPHGDGVIFKVDLMEQNV